jgi:hypothetical protein
MPPTILHGNNLTVSNEYENFTDSGYTTFTVSDFQSPEFLQSMKDSYRSINHPFFANHTPRLCFIQYGQNVLLEEHTTFRSCYSSLFVCDLIQVVQFSIATNMVYTERENQQEATYESEVVDDNIETIHETLPPNGPMSVCLTSNSVMDICEGTSYHGFTKCFNSALSNFQSLGLPTKFNRLSSRECLGIGIHGYLATAANIWRRSSDSEPFTSRPIASLLQATTDAERVKFKTKIDELINAITGGAGNMANTGTSYRLEMTWEANVDNDTRRGENYAFFSGGVGP